MLVRRADECPEQGVRLVRLAVEFGMELAGDVERVVRQFDDFHELAVRRGAAEDEVRLLETVSDMRC